MKNPAAILLCVALAVCCAVCGITGTALQHNLTQPSESAVNLSPSPEKPTPALSDELMTGASVLSRNTATLACSESLVLPLTKGEEANIMSFECDNESVVTVDDGGRLDGLKKGSANVTARFCDNRIKIFEVTVQPAAKKSKVKYTSTAYTANEDVAAANKKKGGAPLYRIMVNRSQNCVTVYTYDSTGEYTVPVRAMVCSCGVEGHETITGEYSTYFKSEWHPLYHDVFGKYVTGISGDYLFHSVPYTDYADNKLQVDEYNKLGGFASRGCVRLAVGDVKWIYDNCADETPVVIFDGDEPGPLGKPEAIRISDRKNGWDPTDPAESNPYRKKKPRITGAEDIELSIGDPLRLTDGIKAYDTCGNDITYRIELIGNVIPMHKGTYRLTYRVRDLLNRSAEQTVTVTIK